MEAEIHLWSIPQTSEISTNLEMQGPCPPAQVVAVGRSYSRQWVTTGGGLSSTKAVYPFRRL